MGSRRDFLKTAATVAAGGAVLGRGVMAEASPLGLPLGIQLYSVREYLPKDYAGTLEQVGKSGFREVEAAGFYNKSAAEVKQAMTAAKLRCVSAHYAYPLLQQHFDEILAFNKELGTDFIICSSPGSPHSGGKEMKLDDWRWLADQFNDLGGKVKSAGLGFGYHNHYHEFGPVDGGVPYTELLKHTDPAKVSFELDCGWAAVAGINPADVLRDNPHRIVMLHVKDFKLPEHPSIENAKEAKVTELGMGSIDYAPVFAQAAKTQKIRHVFVEQEAFDMPWVQSLETDAAYMRKMR